MQAWIDDLASRIESVAGTKDFDEMLDFFGNAAGIGYRKNNVGEFNSALVYLTFGPTITLDTATGGLSCFFFDRKGESRLSRSATKTVNDFFRDLYNSSKR